MNVALVIQYVLIFCSLKHAQPECLYQYLVYIAKLSNTRNPHQLFVLMVNDLYYTNAILYQFECPILDLILVLNVSCLYLCISQDY